MMDVNDKQRSEVGCRIRKWLETRKMSQADLARLTGDQPAEISRYCSGERVPNVASLGKIAQALGVTLDALV